MLLLAACACAAWGPAAAAAASCVVAAPSAGAGAARAFDGWLVPGCWGTAAAPTAASACPPAFGRLVTRSPCVAPAAAAAAAAGPAAATAGGEDAARAAMACSSAPSSSSNTSTTSSTTSTWPAPRSSSPARRFGQGTKLAALEVAPTTKLTMQYIMVDHKRNRTASTRRASSPYLLPPRPNPPPDNSVDAPPPACAHNRSAARAYGTAEAVSQHVHHARSCVPLPPPGPNGPASPLALRWGEGCPSAYCDPVRGGGMTKSGATTLGGGLLGSGCGLRPPHPNSACVFGPKRHLRHAARVLVTVGAAAT